MRRISVSLGAAALLAGAAACSSADEREENRLRLFSRIALLFERYNAALASQDEVKPLSVGAEISRLVDTNIDAMAEALAGEDVHRQSDAAFALGFSRKREAVALLAKAVRSPTAPVRANAIASLGMVAPDDYPMTPFLELLRDPEPVVRQATLFGLRPLVSEGRDRGMLEAILEKLDDPVMDVRNEALILLRKMKKKESIPAIVGKSIKDADPLVRANAAAALGAMGKSAMEVTPELIEMLRDDVHKVVESAWVALKAIHSRDLDRSYGSWRGWYDDETQHLYICLDHRDYTMLVPGECGRCQSKLDRVPREVYRKYKPSAEAFTCPDHPEVLTSTTGKCGRAGCGKDLIPRKPPAALYTCPAHPEVITTTPSQCGKPDCGKTLVPRAPDPVVYACPAHPEVETTTPGRCGKSGCGKDLEPKK
jgi:HEAT repeat protein